LVSDGRPFKLSESFSANRLDKAEEVSRSLEKPAKRLVGYLEVLRIACFYIGFVENVVPGRETVLIAGPNFDEPPVMILGEAAKELEVVRRRTVVGEREEKTGIGSLYRLMQFKG
jgi:hypothetical protein